MASKKIRDVVVKVGEYADRNTGETKGRFENVGALMQGDEDGSYFIMLKRTFNPAGVPKQDDRESILLSCYVPKDRDGQQHNESRQQSGRVAENRDDPRTMRGEPDDFGDSEIPF